MMRTPASLLVAAVVVVLASATAATTVPADSAAAGARAGAGCRAVLTTHNWRVVFAHDSTLIASRARVKKLVGAGHRTAKSENRGCNDYAAVIESPEFSEYKVRAAFAREAAPAGLTVTYAAPADVRPAIGNVNVVFGHRSTVAQASALLVKVAKAGWRDTDIAYGGPGDWKVVWPNVPGRAGEETVPTAMKAGFEVELEVITE